MPRRKRIVIPDFPHHVTQRGVRRQPIFFRDKFREKYLELLRENGARYGVEVLAYCLMTNHVHHLLVPLEKDSLRWTLQYTHKRYADYANAQNGWTGHLWQERFYSSPVDEEFFEITLRYIERNPVKAGIVQVALDYPWSSAAFHCGLREDQTLTTVKQWLDRKAAITDWATWLEDEGNTSKIAALKKQTQRDLPTGSEIFLDWLEIEFGEKARAPKLGRPRKRGK